MRAGAQATSKDGSQKRAAADAEVDDDVPEGEAAPAHQHKRLRQNAGAPSQPGTSAGNDQITSGDNIVTHSRAAVGAMQRAVQATQVLQTLLDREQALRLELEGVLGEIKAQQAVVDAATAEALKAAEQAAALAEGLFASRDGAQGAGDGQGHGRGEGALPGHPLVKPEPLEHPTGVTAHVDAAAPPAAAAAAAGLPGTPMRSPHHLGAARPEVPHPAPSTPAQPAAAPAPAAHLSSQPSPPAHHNYGSQPGPSSQEPPSQPGSQMHPSQQHQQQYQSAPSTWAAPGAGPQWGMQAGAHGSQPMTQPMQSMSPAGPSAPQPQAFGSVISSPSAGPSYAGGAPGPAQQSTWQGAMTQPLSPTAAGNQPQWQQQGMMAAAPSYPLSPQGSQQLPQFGQHMPAAQPGQQYPSQQMPSYPQPVQQPAPLGYSGSPMAGSQQPWGQQHNLGAFQAQQPQQQQQLPAEPDPNACKACQLPGHSRDACPMKQHHPLCDKCRPPKTMLYLIAKTTQNKNRRFFKCDDCGTFHWEDKLPAGVKQRLDAARQQVLQQQQQMPQGGNPYM